MSNERNRKQIKELCAVLEVSADYLLNVESLARAGEEYKAINDEILSNLRNSLDPLELIFGKDLVPIFLDGDFKQEILEMRIRLSREGIMLPVVRVRDEVKLPDKQFIVLAYHKLKCW